MFTDQIAKAAGWDSLTLKHGDVFIRQNLTSIDVMNKDGSSTERIQIVIMAADS